MITLILNESVLKLTKDSYTETLKSIENTLTTEAGTRIREITRTGIYGLAVSDLGTEEEKRILDSAVQQDYLNVTVWDEADQGTVIHRMYITPSSYKASLISEDDEHRYYSFSFTLEDLE